MLTLLVSIVTPDIVQPWIYTLNAVLVARTVVCLEPSNGASKNRRLVAYCQLDVLTPELGCLTPVKPAVEEPVFLNSSIAAVAPTGTYADKSIVYQLVSCVNNASMLTLSAPMELRVVVDMLYLLQLCHCFFVRLCQLLPLDRPSTMITAANTRNCMNQFQTLGVKDPEAYLDIVELEVIS